ncbi:MAG TPA: hypothetical protein VFI77_05510 [Gemmatimonadales bacterium]|nr:hypothetical protein [Gemmatimonadales bacterium]
MKKLAIGCGVLLLLGMVGAGGASYYAYHKVSSAFAGFAELGSLPQLERSVQNQRPFSPPTAGEPSQAQIDRLLEIQGNVRTRLGARADEIEHRYRRLLAKDSVTAIDAPELISAYRDLAAAYMDGKRAQVEALNRAGLSLEEYRWIRSRTYGALGMPLVEVDVARIIDDVKAGRQPVTPASPLTTAASASPALRTRVEPHRKALEATIGLAFFGL